MLHSDSSGDVRTVHGTGFVPSEPTKLLAAVSRMPWPTSITDTRDRCFAMNLPDNCFLTGTCTAPLCPCEL